MAEQTNLKIAGVVENMSWFTCPTCTERHEIFGSGGGAELARDLGTNLLGQIPIDTRLREGSDSGVPLVVGYPDAEASKALLAVADALPPRERSLVGRRLSILT
jgi:ATP-binding protein involved in chromosome partitioning